MKKRLSLLLSVLLAAMLMSALAVEVDMATAERAAMDFLCSRQESKYFMMRLPKELWSHAEPSAVSPAAAYFIIGTDQGFVVVAGDDRARTILAYSDQPVTDMEDLPDGARFWLDLYKRQIEVLQSHPSQEVPARALTSAWGHPAVSISPMLHTQWGQSAPYNSKCPQIDDKYCYVGCSAIAMAQVMRFWQYPSRCDSLPAYTTRTLEIEVPALDATTLDWSLILDRYPVGGSYTTEQVTAVRWLLRYVGQAMNMDYKTGGSDADENDIMQAIRFFGYDESACFVQKSTIEGEVYYPDEIWDAMLWNELNNGRPVIYCGYSMSGDTTMVGHAFNVDGYDAENDTYHVNFGWRGTGDGYYALNAFVLNDYQFDIAQLMFLNLMPPRPKPMLWVNKEELSMNCHVGDTVTQKVFVVGTDLIADITTALDGPDDIFAMTVTHDVSGATVITVTFTPQEPGSYTAAITVSSQGAQSVTVTINGNAEPVHGYALGDTNHDGVVDISDVAYLIDCLLNPDIEPCPICCDVSPDGVIDISDLAALIDLVLRGASS